MLNVIYYACYSKQVLLFYRICLRFAQASRIVVEPSRRKFRFDPSEFDFIWAQKLRVVGGGKEGKLSARPSVLPFAPFRRKAKRATSCRLV